MRHLTASLFALALMSQTAFGAAAAHAAPPELRVHATAAFDFASSTAEGPFNATGPGSACSHGALWQQFWVEAADDAGPSVVAGIDEYRCVGDAGTLTIQFKATRRQAHGPSHHFDLIGCITGATGVWSGTSGTGYGSAKANLASEQVLMDYGFPTLGDGACPLVTR